MPGPAQRCRPLQTTDKTVKAKDLSKICHCEEAAGRRGALSAKREEVPLGCNLAVPDWMTGRLRRIRRLLRKIPTSLRSSE